MEAPARSIQGKNLGSPDETRSFDKGKMDVVTLDNVTVGQAVFEPCVILDFTGANQYAKEEPR